ncbi:unnamed protein product [Penicillium salamii]|uniref:Uncharacterized protein n=1 Tax=Penicillium salamii TaxID=1612424 RepID=A0A9W4K2H6_9EURO|nr:unnamed protein product [Penicillium salamii]CAG8100104.1 unnamed protein product [Penicillium salamii]CAG8294644.1 unnamed protein product [Penicillium salamii]CAG8323891.1 unnamed protein product [Penicillium salamii]CAG8417791.1 unnamed protein product [Penicillium salamii]
MDNDAVSRSISIFAGLPEHHVVRNFSHFRGFRTEVETISQSLRQGGGNQYLVLLNVPLRVLTMLDHHDKECGPINYRLNWQGNTALVKVVPSGAHECITSAFCDIIKEIHHQMGCFWTSLGWVLATTYTSRWGDGMQADNAFVPEARLRLGLPPTQWPTLVVETGVSESLAHLREDAKRWLRCSEGHVRIVILISVRRDHIFIEKWQLAPPNAPIPLNKRYIDSLKAQNRNMPPMVPQLSSLLQAYCSQEITIEQNATSGCPLIIPFEALHDRLPDATDSDILIQDWHFRYMYRFLPRVP